MLVHLRTNTAAASLWRLRGAANLVGRVAEGPGERWEEACKAPCDQRLGRKDKYRVSIPGDTLSRAFVLPDRSEVSVYFHLGSREAVAAGTGLVVVGAIGFAAGLGVLVYGGFAPNDRFFDAQHQTSRDLLKAGGITIGLSTLPILIGALLIGRNPTVLLVDGERPNAGASLLPPGLPLGRGPTWTTRGLAF